MNKLIKILWVGFLLASVIQSYTVQADDTELYVLNVSQTNGVRPKILVILDNSGSMISGYVSPYFSYEKSSTWIPTSNIDTLTNRAFLTSDIATLPSIYTGLHSLSKNYKNNCEASYSNFDVSPYYYAGKFRAEKNSTWNNTPNTTDQVIDCKYDADNKILLNRSTGDNGYPVNTSSYYSTTATVSNSFTSTLQTQYIYSANYLYYRTKLISAKQQGERMSV